jgi:hypothetical protein
VADNSSQIDPVTGQLVQKPAVQPGQQQPNSVATGGNSVAPSNNSVAPAGGAKTLAGATAANGLAAQPSTPAGAASLGVPQKSVDMVGTPNQLAGQLATSPGAGAPSSLANPNAGAQTGESAAPGAVAAESAQPQTPGQSAEPATLTQADRQTAAGQVDATAAADAARAQRFAEMFGPNVGFGVSAMISAAIKQSQAATSTTAGAGGKLVDDATLKSAFAGWTPTDAQLATAKTAIQNYAANPTPDALANLQNALQASGVPAASLASPEQWTGKILTQQSTGALTASQLENQLTLTPDALQQMGVTGDDLQMLGLSPADVQQMSLGQFRQAVADKMQEKTQEVAGLQAQLNDPNLDANTRTAITQQLASLGAVGAVQAAPAAAAAAAGVKTDQQINIGGQSYTVEQLLDDPTLHQLVDSYVNAGPNDQIRKDLEAQLPDLAKFAAANGDALKAAAQTLADTSNTVGKVQQGNQQVIQQLQQQLGGASSTGSSQLNQLLSAAFPNTFGPNAAFTASPIDLSKSGVLQILSQNNMGSDGAGGNSAANLVTDLSTLAKSDPSGVQQLLQLSPDELEKTGLNDPGKLQELITSQAQMKALQSGNPDQIAAIFFPSTAHADGGGDRNAVEGDLAAMQVFGDLPNSIPSSALQYGSNSDRLGAIADALKSQMSGSATSISDAISGKGKVGAVDDPLAKFGQGKDGPSEKQLAKDIPAGIINDPTALLHDFGNDAGTLQKVLSAGIPISAQARDTIAARINALTAPAQMPDAGTHGQVPTARADKMQADIQSAYQRDRDGKSGYGGAEGMSFKDWAASTRGQQTVAQLMYQYGYTQSPNVGSK